MEAAKINQPKKPDYIEGVLRNHGVKSIYVNGKLHAVFEGTDKGGNPKQNIVDTTGWGHKNLLEALGY